RPPAGPAPTGTPPGSCPSRWARRAGHARRSRSPARPAPGPVWGLRRRPRTTLGCVRRTGTAASDEPSARLRPAGQLPRPPEAGVEHRLRETAREGVLLGGVEAAEQGQALARRLGAMGEARAGARRRIAARRAQAQGGVPG